MNPFQPLNPDVQYNIGPVPFHTHNGIDSPTISATGGNSGIGGRVSNPTLASIPINDQTPQALQFKTKDFASGITWDATNFQFVVATAGKYLAYAKAGIGPEVVSGVREYACIYYNGAEAARGVTLNFGAGTEVETPQVTYLMNCVVGDTITFYCGHNANNSIPVSSGATLTYGWVCMV